MTPELLADVPGGPELAAWFGYAPGFHDAEVLGLTLDRDGPRCSLRVHGFEMTREIDEGGYFVRAKHVVVTFHLTDLLALELGDFNHQNALMSLTITRGLEASYRLELDGAYGLSGLIEARQVTIELEPGAPSGS
ncbi:hypothetical protein BH10PSE3_BH10PSE3_37790 [soil metagenome]